ncbi:MAG: hypothetical protein ABJ311_11525, partial [Erythrobacter sp.]
PAIIPDAQTPPSEPPPAQFTREDQAAFLDALSDWGNVRAAARATRVSRTTAYRMRRACPRFRALWDAALVAARPRVEEVLADRALNGVAEAVYYHGEEVAVRTRFDARLLLAHLGRLDRIAGDGKAEGLAADFFAQVEALVKEPEIEFETAAPEPEDAREGVCEWEAQNSPLDTVPSVSDEPELRRDEPGMGTRIVPKGTRAGLHQHGVHGA